MTTSAPPIDHASHIKNISGLFANYYYTQLHKSPSQLFMMYSKNARLTHTVIPEGVEQLSINKDESESVSCSTLEDIKKFYETSYVTNSKVCIHSIDHQSITGNSVLITISGLIALTDTTPVYTFTQTFILTPESNTSEKTYLIANDIFRLIPNDDFESESEVVSEEQKVEAPIFETETTKAAVEEAQTESTPNSEQSAATAAAGVVEDAKVDALKPEVEEKKQKEEPAVEEQEEDVEEEEVKPRAETSAESKTESVPKTKEKTETKQKSKNEGKSKSEKDKEEHKQKAKESSPKTESKQDSKPHAKKETSPVKSEESPQPSKEEQEQAKEKKEEEKEQANEQVEKQEEDEKEEEEEEEEEEEIVKENVKPKQPIPNTWAALASSAVSLPVRSATGSPATQSPKSRAVKPTDSTNASAASAKQAKTTKTTKPLGNITNSQKPSSSERVHKGSFLYGVVLNNVNDLKGPEIKELVERTIGPTIKVEPKGRFCTIAFETEASQKKALSVKSITDHNNVIFTFTKITSDTNFKPRSNNGNQKTNGSSSQGSGQRKRNTGTNGRN
ncbi:hypothetical protein WICPIJ_000050 [Wickerhamomyces pijperi]|uniref:NTF2 domain-containing protein n=1 Tax=Wickerhamomyces pijperi TaxID=599730 RepID=A0A9P8QEU2_WICPI|nr:hypothetical protein WICPIJ_000050 [Wickerhamomyces pijperi]